MSARTNPFEEIERFFERMARQFEETSRPWGSGESAAWWSGAGSMAVDLVEHDDEFVAAVDLPGFSREEISVQITDHTLRVEAEHDEAVEEDAETYLRRERSHRSMQRSISLPEEVDKENVSAEMRDGVLTVTIPKLEVEAARKIEIE